jgi:hypothetical protein
LSLPSSLLDLAHLQLHLLYHHSTAPQGSSRLVSQGSRHAPQGSRHTVNPLWQINLLLSKPDDPPECGRPHHSSLPA